MKRIKRKNTKKKITIIATIVAILWLFGFYIYVTYSKMRNKKARSYEATKVAIQQKVHKLWKK